MSSVYVLCSQENLWVHPIQLVHSWLGYGQRCYQSRGTSYMVLYFGAGYREELWWEHPCSKPRQVGTSAQEACVVALMMQAGNMTFFLVDTDAIYLWWACEHKLCPYGHVVCYPECDPAHLSLQWGRAEDAHKVNGLGKPVDPAMMVQHNKCNDLKIGAMKRECTGIIVEHNGKYAMKLEHT